MESQSFLQPLTRNVGYQDHNMNIEFRELGTVEISDLVELMNNPLVRRHMPLSNDNFDVRECETFLSTKEALWTEYGYGPWAFFIDDEFAGWGLPVTRKSANSLLRLGFRQHGTVTIENKQFNRYLLEKPAYSRNSKN